MANGHTRHVPCCRIHLGRTRSSWRVQVEEDTDIYDEVTEEQYKSIVRGRLAKDDFVVDDGIYGYTDNGMDDFEERDGEQDSEEEGGGSKCTCILLCRVIELHPFYPSAKKGKASLKTKPKARPKPPPAMVTPSISAYRPTVSAEKEEDLMNSLLGQMDDIAPSVTKTKSRKRKPDPDYDDQHNSPGPSRSRVSTHSYRGRDADLDLSSDGPVDFGVPSGPSTDDETFMSPKKKVRTDPPGIRPTIERLEKMEVQSGTDDFSDLDMDAVMDVDDDELQAVPKMEVEKKPLRPLNGSKATDEKKMDSTPGWLSVYDSLSVASNDTLGPLSNNTTKPMNPSNNSILEEDGSLRFFWLDYLEHDGRLYFIGKTQDKQSSAWLSCCVVVENLKRNLFVLPRERRVEQDDETGETYETDVTPSLPDVYADFDRVRKKAGIKSFKAKFVKRKYAFGETDVPRGEAQWLKVVYGFEGQQTIKRILTTFV